MPDRASIVRSRRARRKDEQQVRRARGLMGGIGLGILLSIVTAILILFAALAYADLTRGLPNVALLPALLNPPEGLLLHPTRVYDRTGTHMLFEFEPATSAGDVRRYIPISAAAPQHLPELLVKSSVVLAEPGFWTGGGYTLAGLNDPNAHPTVAQKLASELLLYSEPPSLRRALRERILAAQLIAQYGRSQVLEWYLNSADYGNDAYGIDAAARLYFGKPATDLSSGESAVLAAVSQAPDLNPIDAPDMARERGRTAINLLKTFKLITPDEAADALASVPASAVG